LTPSAALFGRHGAALFDRRLSLADFVPQPALAGVLLCTAWRIIDPPRLWDCLRSSRADAAVVLAILCDAVFIRVEIAVLVGIASSLVCRGLVSGSISPRAVFKEPLHPDTLLRISLVK
jgi:SulP family sulfate permease